MCLRSSLRELGSAFTFSHERRFSGMHGATRMWIDGQVNPGFSGSPVIFSLARHLATMMLRSGSYLRMRSTLGDEGTIKLHDGPRLHGSSAFPERIPPKTYERRTPASRASQGTPSWTTGLRHDSLSPKTGPTRPKRERPR